MAESVPSFIRDERERDRKQAEWDAAHGIGANDATDTPPFVIPDLAGFLSAELPPPRFVVERLIPRGTVTLLGAHGGAGKSVLALTIAAHVATGATWAGFGVERGPALFVSLEDPSTLVLYRLRRIVTTYNLDADAVAANLRVFDGADGNGALGVEHVEFGARQLVPTVRFDYLRERVAGACLIVIDNASDAFDGNENERRMVRGFVRLLAQVARTNDAGVLLLAHIDKHAARFGASGNTYSGSTAWHNSARSRLAMLPNDEGIELRPEKLNVGKLADPLVLRWSEHGVLVPWATTTETTVHDGDAEMVLAALREAATHDVSVPVARTGPATAQRALETLDVLPEALRGTRGRVRFWRAMNRLQRERCASSEEFRDANRKLKKRFVVSPESGLRQFAGLRQSPIPPVELAQGTCARAPVCASYQTGAELAQTSAPENCPACDGEGCAHCVPRRVEVQL